MPAELNITTFATPNVVPCRCRVRQNQSLSCSHNSDNILMHAVSVGEFRVNCLLGLYDTNEMSLVLIIGVSMISSGTVRLFSDSGSMCVRYLHSYTRSAPTAGRPHMTGQKIQEPSVKWSCRFVFPRTVQVGNSPTAFLPTSNAVNLVGQVSAGQERGRGLTNRNISMSDTTADHSRGVFLTTLLKYH